MQKENSPNQPHIVVKAFWGRSYLLPSSPELLPSSPYLPIKRAYTAIEDGVAAGEGNAKPGKQASTSMCSTVGLRSAAPISREQHSDRFYPCLLQNIRCHGQIRILQNLLFFFKEMEENVAKV